jgi:hypothetical protein
VAVCLAGGEKEVDVLNAELDMARRLDNNPLETGTITIERQCDVEYLEDLDDVVKDYDAILSMACGVGIQFLAERFPEFRSTRRWIPQVCRPTWPWDCMKSAADPAVSACSA